ncbi:MAG: FtsX-like permease family protein [Caldilineaceae bacterium]
MKVSQFFLMALESLFRHKLRTLLTLLGLIVGISSVLVMTGIGRGFGQSAEEELASLLPNKLTLRQPYMGDASTTALTLQTVSLLQKLVGHSAVSLVVPKKELSDLTVKGLDTTQLPLQATATTADYVQTGKMKFARGRFFTAREEQTAAFVAVVNQSLLTALAGANPTEPTSLTINNIVFQIVGVTQNEGMLGASGLPQLFLPIGLLQKYITSQSLAWQDGALVVEEVAILAVDVPHVAEAKREVEQLLRLLYGLRRDQPNNFDLQGDQETLGFAQDFTKGFTLVLGGIGAISLIVGGIGIMNILLATVAERTREIGVRKAIGASDGDILIQFLIEAITICLLGGALGVGLSYGISSLINLLFSGPDASIPLRVVIDLRSLFIAVLCSVICGVLFGLYPALRAMRLNPIDALRYE